MKNFTLKAAMLAVLSLMLLVIGCTAEAVDVAPTATAEEQVVGKVRIYRLQGKNPAVMEEVELKVAASVEKGDIAQVSQKLALAACTINNGGLTNYLMIHHDAYFSTYNYWICVQGTGDLDLTTTYYANPFSCFWAPNYNVCVNNLRVSGNVRSLWNGNVTASQCAFLGPNFSVYTFNNLNGAIPYYNNNAPANLQNATYLTCY